MVSRVLEGEVFLVENARMPSTNVIDLILYIAIIRFTVALVVTVLIDIVTTIFILIIIIAVLRIRIVGVAGRKRVAGMVRVT